MKKVFIYFSETGNGDFIAEKLKERGYEIKQVTPKRRLPKGFFFKVLFGGFIAGLNVKSKLKDFDFSVDGYDEIVIGSPVWNGKISCPINTVLAKTDFSGKKVSFILYSGGGTAPKAEERLKKEFPSSPVTILKEPKKYPETLNI